MMAVAILFLLLPVVLLAITIVFAFTEGRNAPYPFTIGRVISNGFVAIGGAPLAILGTNLVLNAPASLAQPALVGLPQAFWPVVGGGGLIWFILWPFAQLFMIALALDTLGGRAADVPAALRIAGRRLLPGIAVVLLGAIGIFIGLALLIIPGIIAVLTWFVVLPVLVAEGRGVTDCFGRSGELLRGMRWRLLLLLVIVGVLWLLFAVLGQGLAAAIGGIGSGWTPAIVEAVVGTLAGAVQTGVVAAVYHEVRTAKEGSGSHDLSDVFA